MCFDIWQCFSESTPTKEVFRELAKNNQLFIAEEEGRIIWFVSYKTIWNESIMLQFLRIHSDFHRKWIGSILVKHVEKEVSRKGAYEVFSTVLANNIPSKKLHEKLGYKESGYIDFDSGKELVYIKVL